MTITQLEYAVALETHRQFGRAAEACSVTQSTLSMQIQKLEEDLGLRLFDRSQPITPTEAGREVLAQARRVLRECEQLRSLVDQQKNELAGELRLGVIPTVAPYLLPLFLGSFLKNYPDVQLKITELTTGPLLERLKTQTLDAGLLVTPLSDAQFTEHRLFEEELVAYVSPENGLYPKKFLLSDEIDPGELWLLEEGHCLRSQIEALCQLKRRFADSGFEYQSGSLETLRRMVHTNGGVTILPEMATYDFDEDQMALIRHFQEPAPVREVSLVTHRNYQKFRLIEALGGEIQSALPARLRPAAQRRVVPVSSAPV
jgi:LysR family hydrogen peroxide-inducible transcriptional activator